VEEKSVASSSAIPSSIFSWSNLLFGSLVVSSMFAYAVVNRIILLPRIPTISSSSSRQQRGPNNTFVDVDTGDGGDDADE
jgi:hypothetical protein